jgi:hypothetical protein
VRNKIKHRQKVQDREICVGCRRFPCLALLPVLDSICLDYFRNLGPNRKNISQLILSEAVEAFVGTFGCVLGGSLQNIMSIKKSSSVFLRDHSTTITHVQFGFNQISSFWDDFFYLSCSGGHPRFSVLKQKLAIAIL